MIRVRFLLLSLGLWMALGGVAMGQDPEDGGRFLTEKDWTPWGKAVLKPDTVKKLLVMEDEGFDLVKLGEFKNLKGLILNDVPLKDLGFLSSFPQLTVLELQGNGLKRLDGIEVLQSLRDFSCHSNFITDLSPLDSMESLRMLKLYDNEIRDLSGISHLTNLLQLDVAGNPIQSIAPIAHWTQLRSFSVYKCAFLEDISPIGSWTALEDLNLSFLNLPEFSLALLAEHKQLKSLRVQGVVHHDRELQYIMHHTRLEQLTMGKNDSITTIDSLRYLVNLKYLDIHSNNVKDLYTVRNFPKLVKLVAYRNQVSDLSPLLSCRELRSLFIQENPIKDYGPLFQMGYLQHLNIAARHFDENQQQQLKRALRTTNINFM